MGDLHGLKFDEAARIKPEAFTAFSSDERSQEIPVTYFHPFFSFPFFM
jgi:2,3-bisphosphoglycerate-dependent phosphoglycerate mutase